MSARVASVFLLVLGAARAAKPLLDGYTHVPGGWVLHKSCIFEHADGLVDLARNYTCAHPPYRAPEEQIYAMDVHLGDDSSRQTSFNASWTVPKLPPSADGQTVYFWPGFKNTQPEMGYPVFQPVLQYGQNGQPSWEFQSWFVFGNAGIAHTGPAIAASPGQALVSWMNQDSSSGLWTCYSKNSATGKSSTLKQTSSQMGDTTFFQYAMLVLETISVDQCSDLPDQSTPVVFTGVTVNGKVPSWAQRVTKTNCGDTLKVGQQGGTVSMSWTNN